MDVISVVNCHADMTIQICDKSNWSNICSSLMTCLQLFVPPVFMQDPIVDIEAQRRVLIHKVWHLFHFLQNLIFTYSKY